MSLVTSSSGVLHPSRLSFTPGDRSGLGLTTIVGLSVLLVLCMLVATTIGASNLSVADVVTLIWSSATGQLNTASVSGSVILFEIRFPRVLTGALVGAALATSGAVMQGLFRNPLADPGLIGVSAGAALFAGVIIVLGATVLSGLQAALGYFLLPIGAFIGALCVTALLYRISTHGGVTSIATLLLAGLAVNALAGALLGILIFISDDQQLRDLNFWQLGSLAGATWEKTQIIAPLIMTTLLALFCLGRGLNALVLGESQARYIGVSTQSLKRLGIVLVALATGSAVAVAGAIGFVGIIAPHLLRLIIGPDNRYLLPASALLGGTFVVMADAVCRVIVAPAELPIGIVMALAGAPFFLWILLKRRGMLD
ncbi:FecCD family ABC transporter permease [Coralliovum pocilloporae]|uniref:FecCD family ABC transporter permease n=1 Tax=Coralliovum pocilloporae TaxID=3066369 RepID=UPI003306F663